MPQNTSEEIKLKIGEITTIKLTGLSTAGYEWSFKIDNNEDCIKVSKDFALQKKSTQKNMGGSADEIFTISAKKKGVVNIHFTQQRSWEKNIDPAEERTIKIIVE